MDLSEIGTRVEGLVSVRNRVPVTGSVSGGSVSLSGEYLVEPCLYDWEGRFCTQRVRNFSATVDAAGEMHGTMEYSEEGWGRIHYRYTVTGEFRNLLRRYD